MSSNTRSCCSWTSSTCSPEPAPSRLPAGRRPRGIAPAQGRMARARRRSGRDRPPGRGIRVRQRIPAPHGAPQPFGLADRPVTCGEWLSFMEDDGYRRPEFWLSDGWAVVNTRALGRPSLLVTGPRRPRRWLQFTLVGPASGRPERAGLPHQLLRGRRLRTLDRHAAARPSRNGRRSRRRTVKATTSPRRRPCDRGPHPRPALRPTRSSATPGNGPRVPTRPIPGSGPRPAPWASTTGSSW